MRRVSVKILCLDMAKVRMRLELTFAGLLLKLANHYVT